MVANCLEILSSWVAVLAEAARSFDMVSARAAMDSSMVGGSFFGPMVEEEEKVNESTN